MNKFARFVRTNTFKGSAAVGSLMLAAQAHAAAGDDGITAALAAIDLTTVAASVAAIGLLIVAIAMAFKGPDVAKRVIRKV